MSNLQTNPIKVITVWIILGLLSWAALCLVVYGAFIVVSAGVRLLTG